MNLQTQTKSKPKITRLESLDDLNMLLNGKDVILVKNIKFQDCPEETFSEKAIYNPTEEGIVEVIMPHPANNSVIRSYKAKRKNLEVHKGDICFYEDKSVTENYCMGQGRYLDLINKLNEVGLLE